MKQALRDRHARDGEERSDEVEEMLPDEEREDDEHRVNLGGVSHDLRIQNVRLDLVDADDPYEHEDRRPERLR